METRRLSKYPAEYSKFYNGMWYEYEDEYGDILYIN